MRAESLHAAGYKMTAATAAKRLPLLMSSLHGLTKYAHLIDVDYFADLLQVWVCMAQPTDIQHACAVLVYTSTTCMQLHSVTQTPDTVSQYFAMYHTT